LGLEILPPRVFGVGGNLFTAALVYELLLGRYLLTHLVLRKALVPESQQKEYKGNRHP